MTSLLAYLLLALNPPQALPPVVVTPKTFAPHSAPACSNPVKAAYCATNPRRAVK